MICEYEKYHMVVAFLWMIPNCIMNDLHDILLLLSAHLLTLNFPVCREKELLLMPKNSGKLPLVQWPLFLLASKVSQRFSSLYVHVSTFFICFLFPFSSIHSFSVNLFIFMSS